MAAALSPWALGRWLDYSDAPAPSDVLVVLCGEYARTFHAADLFKQGYAPEIWVARPAVPPSFARAARLGVRLPREEDVHLRILGKLGVPRPRVRLYGLGVLSTYEEAAALRRTLGPAPKRLLLVTSRWHARRVKRVFSDAFPTSRVLVSSTPYEPFSRRWWTDQSSARAAVLEVAKTAYYMAGGRFTAASRPQRDGRK